MQKFKSVELKAASAQEAIDKVEKLERDIRTKNLKFADMIRERDRALHEKDRLEWLSTALKTPNVAGYLPSLADLPQETRRDEFDDICFFSHNN